ncbi:phenylalanyl-tRNA synthetase subunit alpha [Formosa sp. Hel1_33_131]|uniref:hypothetical protein n=1 Tax=Formosa sp. Hel1_33_131 TaxID=1336794 RepID=UPI00084E1DBC|nr:hypothetical protein [Formosa sp. Hel1_33_131]AOR28277.1 phenylalanyl-tRNA synthetase subunit alpha [Formosa sp. Hel1_33_131]
MKKDILIPEVKDVYIAVVHEYNDTYKVYDWNAYIINDKSVDLEMVIIVTKGYSEDKKTATFRKKIEALPAKSYTKIEMLLEDVLSINNLFNVSFFEDNKLFEKAFEFRKNTINENALQQIPLMKLKGVLKS